MSQPSSKPFVSVVMPVCNGERTVETAARSVLQQSYTDLELIICDDGSTDTTVNSIRRINDARIVLLMQHPNQGPGPARDRAIAVARGTWLAVIDADDAWHPDRLKKLLTAAAADKVMVFDDLMQCHDTPDLMVPWRALRGKHAFGGDGNRPVDVSVVSFLSAPRMLIKPLVPMQLVRNSGARHGTSSFGEDTRFFLEVLASGVGVRYLPEPLYFYRITPRSLTSAWGREAQMLATFEELRSRFVQDSHVLAAFDRKILSLRRARHYASLLARLKTGEVHLLWREIRSMYWFLPMLLRKLGEDWSYLVHARRHQAQRRFRQ